MTQTMDFILFLVGGHIMILLCACHRIYVSTGGGVAVEICFLLHKRKAQNATQEVCVLSVCEVCVSIDVSGSL